MKDNAFDLELPSGGEDKPKTLNPTLTNPLNFDLKQNIDAQGAIWRLLFKVGISSKHHPLSECVIGLSSQVRETNSMKGPPEPH